MECRLTVVLVGEPDLGGYLIPLEGQDPALGASEIRQSDNSNDLAKNTIHTDRYECAIYDGAFQVEIIGYAV